ncbi:hypothetical protein [Bacillus suaedae]|uniref:Uncharacterized protein n=1 Tax=Halalkalibacter suaedae TaxID=2822140 RepID=A0A940WZN8_9BACI|nr:hypothetical protein [Bacillus suaedae]MBP3951711.1 hypothetical protein [Bacillus suaedae]
MESTWKRLGRYICFLVLFLGFIYLGLKFQMTLRENESLSYRHLAALESFFPIIIGVVLAMPNVIKSLTKKGHWKVDWIKLIVIGLPFLYLSIVPIMYIIGVLKIDLPFSAYAMGSYIGGDLLLTFVTINGIVAGYMLCTSFYKRNSKGF